MFKQIQQTPFGKGRCVAQGRSKTGEAAREAKPENSSSQQRRVMTTQAMA
jgi:hypothetical protein